jgi:hypothetical protein
MVDMDHNKRSTSALVSTVGILKCFEPGFDKLEVLLLEFSWYHYPLLYQLTMKCLPIISC